MFFSHQTGEAIRVHKVYRRGQRIEIFYRIRPRETANVTATFALIPLGKLTAGKYDVGITSEQQRPSSQRVCTPFSFTVEKK